MSELHTTDVLLRTAQIVPVTEAEGPGKRFALWFQGCPLRCPGCCNPEMLPFAGGKDLTLTDVLEQICAVRADIEGITLLGGEPFAHAASAAPLAETVRNGGLSVMIFSGHTLEELRSRDDLPTMKLLDNTDILVDAPYVRELPETRRRWIGSSNQRVHFLSDRCNPGDPRWLLPNTLEIRLRPGELTVNGFPATSALGLWQRVRPVQPKGSE